MACRGATSGNRVSYWPKKPGFQGRNRVAGKLVALSLAGAEKCVNARPLVTDSGPSWAHICILFMRNYEKMKIRPLTSAVRLVIVVQFALSPPGGCKHAAM